MEKHPLFSGFEPEHNKFLKLKKNDLLKLCKEKKIDAEYDDNQEDLAFLLYRYDENFKLTSDKLETALDELGINAAHNKANNVLLLITYELALVDLYDEEIEELTELANEIELPVDGLDREDMIIEIAVKMVNG